MLPLTWALLVLVRFIASLDELQRRVHSQAGGFASALTCLLVFTWGMLEMAGVPSLRGVLVMPIFCGLYAAGVWYLTRKYA
jgi:hypothetical protein